MIVKATGLSTGIHEYSISYPFKVFIQSLPLSFYEHSYRLPTAINYRVGRHFNKQITDSKKKEREKMYLSVRQISDSGCWLLRIIGFSHLSVPQFL